jgi:uncharacterized protein with FMN-binding domain
MKAIYVSIISGIFSLNQLGPQILLFGGSIIITFFLGRFFCGFICSFGAMGDLIWFISQKTLKLKWKVNEKADAWLKKLKYIILIAVVVGIWTLKIGINSMASPWTVFGIYSNITGWTSVSYLLSIGGFLLLLIIIGSIFIERFFCRYMCPLGAVFAISSKFKIFRIKKKRENCGSCKLCTMKCSMGIPLYKYDTVTSGECINCFACTTNCPKHNAKANTAPAVASAVSTAAMFGLVYAGSIATKAYTGNTNSAIVQQTQDKGSYIDGTYTGTGNGFRGETKTSVTVENGNITDITVVSYQDDEEYFNRAENTVISEILSNQDTNVDAVSGATFSSKGIMASVADALTNAGVTTTTDATAAVSDNNTTDSSSDNTAALSDTVYKDGTYTGMGTGFRGETSVSVTVENGKISDITINSYEDDEDFFQRAKTMVVEEILASQDTNVDAVSGATFSSNGIMEAVANALDVPYTNHNSELPRKGHRNGLQK